MLTGAYALSPVDLIPDVIPVLGLLDDLPAVSFGVWLAVRLVPPAMLGDACRVVAERPPHGRALGRLGLLVAVWLGALVGAWAPWSYTDSEA